MLPTSLVEPLHTRRWAHHLGLAGLYLGALSIPISNAGCSIAIGLVLLSSLLSIPDLMRETFKDPVFWMVGVFVVYVVLHQLVPQKVGPGPWTDTLDFLKATFFWLTGYWFWRHRRHLFGFMTAYAVAFIVQSLAAFPWHNAVAALSGRYMVTLGFDHIVCGELAGLAAFILLFTVPVKMRRHNARLALPITLVSLLAGLWAAYILVLTASRSAWVATLLSALLIAATYARTLARSLRHSAKLRHLLIATLIGIGLIGAATAPMLESRVEPIVHALTSYHARGEAGLQGNSAGIRLRLQLFGVRAWSEKPLFGWGPSSSYRLIQREGINSHATPGNKSTSLLNTPLKIVVELGAVGGILCLSVLILLIRGLLACWAKPGFPEEIVLTAFTILVFELVFSLFDVTFFLRGIALILFGAGMAYALSHAGRSGGESSAPA